MSFLPPAAPTHRARRQAAIGSAAGRLAAVTSGDDLLTNLYSVLAESFPEEEAAGLAWYATAHVEAQALADRHGLTLRQAAGIIAALSPQTGWNANLRLADALAADPDTNPGHYADAYVKARAIARGEDPFLTLGGRKVRSFYANIVDPYRSGPVTVDRHAVDALTNTRFLTSGSARASSPDPKLLERPGTYQLCAATFRTAARALGLRPHEVQAIAWLTWRRINAVPEF